MGAGLLAIESATSGSWWSTSTAATERSAASGGWRSCTALTTASRSSWWTSVRPPDFSAEAERAFDGLRVIATGCNIGFGGACNVGIHALPDVDAIALLNNDARPEPGWLTPLLDRLTVPGVGAATPKVVLADALPVGAPPRVVPETGE